MGMVMLARECIASEGTMPREYNTEENRMTQIEWRGTMGGPKVDPETD
jgi:hypothetical protein